MGGIETEFYPQPELCQPPPSPSRTVRYRRARVKYFNKPNIAMLDYANGIYLHERAWNRVKIGMG
jgi:hypothetical protein